jgi:hypothetical protein
VRHGKSLAFTWLSGSRAPVDRSSQDQGRLPGGRLFRLRRVTWKSTPSNQGCLLLVRSLLRRDTLTPTTLRGPAPNGHPCPDGALAASMPLGPLRVVCVRPAPKSRLAVFGLSMYENQKQIKSRSKASRLKPVPLCRRPHHFRCLCFCFCSSNAKGSNAAKRDLGAGRAQVLRSGPSRMDAARAPSGHGCPFGAGPRSKTGAREFRRRRNLARSRHPWLLGVLFQVTRRRRNVCR